MLRAGIEHEIYAIALEHRLSINAMPAENCHCEVRLLWGKAKAIGMIALGHPSHRGVAEAAQTVEDHDASTVHLFSQPDFASRCDLAHIWSAAILPCRER